MKITADPRKKSKATQVESILKNIPATIELIPKKIKVPNPRNKNVWRRNNLTIGFPRSGTRSRPAGGAANR